MSPQENAKNAMQYAQEVNETLSRMSRKATESKELGEILQAAVQISHATQSAALTATQLSHISSNDVQIQRKIQETTDAFAEAAKRAVQTAAVCEKCVEMELSNRS